MCDVSTDLPFAEPHKDGQTRQTFDETTVTLTAASGSVDRAGRLLTKPTDQQCWRARVRFSGRGGELSPLIL